MSDVPRADGWWQASDGSWYAPEQRPGPQAPPNDRASSAPKGRSSPGLDLKRISPAEWATAIATVLLFISLYLPWFTYNFGLGSVSVDGLWHSWMYVVLALCVAIVSFIATYAGDRPLPRQIPLSKRKLLGIATSANALLTILAFLFKPGGIGFHGIGWGIGAFMGLAASIVAAVPPVIGWPRSKSRASAAAKTAPPGVVERRPAPAPVREPPLRPTRFCSSCGHELGPDSRFCTSCGAAYEAPTVLAAATATAVTPAGPATRLCSSCGHELGPDSRFCTSCGAAYEAPTVLAAPTAPAVTPAARPTRFCSSCGHELGPDSRFCTSCGAQTGLG
jgi:uncharacterized OB-fold protein